MSGKGIELWNRAKQIIPGGTQLLSKRSELFLPNQWPAYFQRAKGVEIWDLEGNKFIDMSYMGIGSCILGYADAEVNGAVKRVIDDGSMTTLNAPEDVELAELLLRLHPWAGQVRFARTGGEALAVAVRIARAYTRKDTVAFCGYHGWHDWYLAANLADDKNLDGQLLPGLKPLGVPRGLKGTAIPFHYNQIDELQEIMRTNNDVGVIFLETIRQHYPQDGFLEKVCEIAREANALLVLDEVTSGWRLCVGGAYQKFGIIPDIVVYAKALSNGYPMAAVVGKGEVMEAAQDTFISSTYWTERIGSAAALATIEKLQRCDVPSHLIKIGNLISKGWQDLAERAGLRVSTAGIPPLTALSFDYEGTAALPTLFRQEMLKRGFLTKDAVYVSYSHSEEHVSDYLQQVAEVFQIIKDAVDNDNVYQLLEGPVAQTGFARLT